MNTISKECLQGIISSVLWIFSGGSDSVCLLLLSSCVKSRSRSSVNTAEDPPLIHWVSGGGGGGLLTRDTHMKKLKQMSLVKKCWHTMKTQTKWWREFVEIRADDQVMWTWSRDLCSRGNRSLPVSVCCTRLPPPHLNQEEDLMLLSCSAVKHKLWRSSGDESLDSTCWSETSLD